MIKRVFGAKVDKARYSFSKDEGEVIKEIKISPSETEIEIYGDTKEIFEKYELQYVLGKKIHFLIQVKWNPKFNGEWGLTEESIGQLLVDNTTEFQLLPGNETFANRMKLEDGIEIGFLVDHGCMKIYFDKSTSAYDTIYFAQELAQVLMETTKKELQLLQIISNRAYLIRG